MRIPLAHIEPELAATERYGAIRELVLRLLRAGALSPSAEVSVLNALTQREEIMSTGIGFRLAIPRVESDLVSKPVFAFGRSRIGLEFESLDGIPVEFVFLFILPKGWFTKEQCRRLMVKIMAETASPNKQQRLQDCTSAADIAAVLEDSFRSDGDGV